ncbi:MAG: polysaccharide lyase, partial [Planctomycetes bacterium]|nr:polysaccharide lyase [Planctomycetota bacterium]
VRIIEEVRSGKVTYEAGKGIITDIKQVGGYPEYRGDPTLDSDGDGIPDWWEIKYGLDPHNPSDAARDSNGDGYSNLEKYLNGIDPGKRLDFKDPKNNVTTLTRDKLFPPGP